MTYTKVKVNPLFIKRKKLELLRSIENWEDAEDYEDEKECEDRVRKDLIRLIEFEPKWMEYASIQELKFWLIKDLNK